MQYLEEKVLFFREINFTKIFVKSFSRKFSWKWFHKNFREIIFRKFFVKKTSRKNCFGFLLLEHCVISAGSGRGLASHRNASDENDVLSNLSTSVSLLASDSIWFDSFRFVESQSVVVWKWQWMNEWPFNYFKIDVYYVRFSRKISSFFRILFFADNIATFHDQGNPPF